MALIYFDGLHSFGPPKWEIYKTPSLCSSYLSVALRITTRTQHPFITYFQICPDLASRFTNTDQFTFAIVCQPSGMLQRLQVSGFRRF